VALGAIFPTKTKGPHHPIQGIKKLQELVSQVKIPVVAIGGIQRENFPQILETGVSAVAMISALTSATNVTEEAKWFVKKMGK
jgi:thiamine-phosphate diphosphorylase